MSRTRTFYIAVMSFAGLVLGVAPHLWPGFREAAGGSSMWLLLVSLLVDAAAMSGRFGLKPLTMRLRFAGVASGAILLFVADFALAQRLVAG